LLQSWPTPSSIRTNQTRVCAIGADHIPRHSWLAPPAIYGLNFHAGQGDSTASITPCNSQSNAALRGRRLVAGCLHHSKLITNADTLTRWLEAGHGSIRISPTSRASVPARKDRTKQRLVISYVLAFLSATAKRYMGQFHRGLGTGWSSRGMGSGWIVTVFPRGLPLSLQQRQPETTPRKFAEDSPPQLRSELQKGCTTGGNSNKDQ